MKKIIFTMLALFVAQSAFAQIVTKDDPMGTVYTYELNYSDGNNLLLEQKLVNIDGERFTFQNKQELPEPLGAIELETSVIVKDGKIIESVGERQKLMEEQMSKLSGLSVKITIEGDLGYTPLTGKVGDEFEPYSNTSVIKVMGMSQTLKVDVTRIKIVGEESITTPAGTFDTFILEAVGESTATIMGREKTTKTSTKSWIAPNKGIIKSIIDDGSGNITTQTLKSIERP